MKFFIPGFILGIALNLPIFPIHTGFGFYPEFSSAVNAMENIAPSEIKSGPQPTFTVKRGDTLFRLQSNGSAASVVALGGLAGVSGNGEYYIRYEKVGTEVEFCGNNQRFWKQKSREYPYLSYSGSLIFMLNGDQSAVRILDINGNTVGVGTIAGRVCTSIAFAPKGDYGAVGFLDGAFEAVGPNGASILKGRSENNGMIKGIALSNNGEHVAVHVGDAKIDWIELYDIPKNSCTVCRLKGVHKSKTAICISDDGKAAVMDTGHILLMNTGGVYSEISIDEKKNGQASIVAASEPDIWVAAYTTAQGISKFLAVTSGGKTIYSKDFPQESFLSASVADELILLRGSDNLYCYSFFPQAK